MEKYPFIFSVERKYRLRRHIAFWFFWWAFQGFLYAFTPSPTILSYPERMPGAFLNSIIYLPVHIFLAYSLMYFVIPGYLIKEKYLAAAGWVITLFIAAAFFSSSLGMYIIPLFRRILLPGKLYLPHPDKQQALFLSLLAGLRGGITIGGIAAAIKLMKYWYIKEQRNLQLQKENMESQLQLLKAQVHPHFLFNTLNNIYSHTQNTSPTASRLVAGLSDLLRFVLYEATQPIVPLEKELKMIKDFISLEKIRYGNRLELDINVPDKTNDLYIAPLLLLPLIENCFKHGTSNILEQPWISLHITLRDKQMQMKLLNGKVNDSKQKEQSLGIGIQNVEKRLNLLYPEKYELNITNDEEVFIVNLKIELEQKKEPVIKSVTVKQQTTHA
ncbi:MAG: sensor histidine kinase [Chitinophagaceae bacterium]